MMLLNKNNPNRSWLCDMGSFVFGGYGVEEEGYT